MSIGFEPYVSCFNDVLGDGNCRFRAIAIGLGFGEEAWPQVRANMLSELKNHHEVYTCLYDILKVTIELIHKHFQFNKGYYSENILHYQTWDISLLCYI